MDDADADAAVIAAAEEHVKDCLNVTLLPRPTDCLACYLHRAVARVRRQADVDA